MKLAFFKITQKCWRNYIITVHGMVLMCWWLKKNRRCRKLKWRKRAYTSFNLASFYRYRACISCIILTCFNFIKLKNNVEKKAYFFFFLCLALCWYYGFTFALQNSLSWDYHLLYIFRALCTETSAWLKLAMLWIKTHC